MKVIITEKMVKAHPKYTEPEDCPLYHAIKEQHPDFSFSNITSNGMILMYDGKLIRPSRGTWNGAKHVLMVNSIVSKTVKLEYNI